MENLERVQARLDRIRAIQPVLAALRTISLASWRMALRQRTLIQPYLTHVARAAACVPPRVLEEAELRGDRVDPGEEPPQPDRLAVLVLGSERGLCGRYNTVAVERAEQYLDQEVHARTEVELLALGSRIRLILERRDHVLTWAGNLSLTKLPPFQRALDLTREWFARYEAREVDGLHVIYNNYRGMGHYEPQVLQVIPAPALRQAHDPPEEAEPAVIVETAPVSLSRRLIEQWTAARLHEVLISSAAAEHSTRYQLMAGASRNAERIIDELTLVILYTRQQAITREMQELAAGAGLIGQRPS